MTEQYRYKYEYKLGIGSTNKSLIPEDLPALLAQPALARLIFPATLAVAPRKQLEIPFAQDFQVSMIPKAMRTKDNTTLFLHPKNGMELFIRIETPLPDNWEHSFTLSFNREHVERRIVSIDVLKQVMDQVAERFGPIGSLELFSVPDDSQDIPHKFYQEVHLRLPWIKYYPPQELEKIGRERFERLRTCYEKYEWQGGIVIILQEEPFDWQNPEHLARREQAHKELGFDLL